MSAPRLPFHLADASRKPAPSEACYICGRDIGCSGERDHFPTPRSLGGEHVAAICRTCHDWKDRLPLGRWDPAVAFEAMFGLWSKATPRERLLLAKMFHIIGQSSATMESMTSARRKA